MSKTWHDIKQGKHIGAPKQTSYNQKALDYAVWYLNGLAIDFASKRMTACEFQGNYDMTQRLNMPIHCKKIGTEGRTKRPLYQCFKYPPLGRDPLKPIDLGLCKAGKGGKKK